MFDDESKPARAKRNAEKLLEDGAEILFGPYGSAAGRAVASLAHERGVLVWNHGAAADDVARAGVITLPTPASGYFVKVVEFAWARGCTSAFLLEADTLRGTNRIAPLKLRSFSSRTRALFRLSVSRCTDEWDERAAEGWKTTDPKPGHPETGEPH